MNRYMYYVLLVLALGQMCGCAATVPYGIYEDKRLSDTIADDAAISTGIKTALLQADFSDGWGTGVYCYYGKVYMVGEVPANMQGKAVELARKEKGVRSVTTHWFTPAKSDTNNFVLRTRLRTNLIGAKGVSNTRVDTEVNAGRVVLLGVVQNEKERGLVIKAAKDTQGVREVTSFLMLPQ